MAGILCICADLWGNSYIMGSVTKPIGGFSGVAFESEM